nr:hypothetical protein [Tanacetum cinerariifolium]
MKQIQGKEGKSYSGIGYKANSTSSGGTIQANKKGLLNATIVKVKDTWR